ncbi:MAG: hypothetical protein PHY56_05960 [Candidatus Omnitrophica bacterium]|nr:hypothetical protein [Candidatus Omnitrophota bacterium]
MIVLILINLVVIANAVIIAGNFFKAKGLAEFTLTAFILFFAQIVLIELILGSLGLFYFSNVFLINLLIFTVTVLIYRRNLVFFPAKPDIEPFIRSNLLLLAFSVFSAFFLAKSFINLINPPWCPDSLQYHLTFPATWIRNGNLNNPFVIFGGVFNSAYPRLETSGISYFPINAELFFAWLMMPLRNAFLADIGEAPFYIIGIIAIYAILRRYSVNKKIALLSGFIWVLIPNIFKQLKAGSQIDVICSVLLFLVIFTFLMLRKKLSIRNACLFGISVGLFVGTKILNIVWLAGLFPLIFYGLFTEIKVRKPGFRKVIILLSSTTAMIILFGGYMFIKNFIFTGNPLFPTQVTIFGKTIFKGLLDTVTCNKLYYAGDRLDLWKITFAEGLGMQFLLIILPGILLPLALFTFLRKRERPFMEYLLTCITPLIMLAVYGALVNSYVTRYLFPFVSAGLLCSVIFIARIPRGEKYFGFAAFVSIFASAFELAHRYELIFSILFSLVLFIALVIYKKQVAEFYKSKIFGKAAFAALVFVALALIYFNGKYDKEEFSRYPSTFSKKESWQLDIARAWQKLNEVTGFGSHVAYTGRQEFYPLFGARLKNDVKYVSANEKEITPYNKPDGLCRKVKDFSAWRTNLKKEKIGYLFIALPFFDNRESEDAAKFPIEDEWALTHTQDFQLLYANSLARIYKVLIINE